MIRFNIIFGQIEIESPYLWKNGNGHKPLIDEMKITHQGRSETVNRALSDFGSEESFGQAAKRFKEHYKYDCSASTVSRETKLTAQEAQKYAEEKLSEAGNSYGEPIQSQIADKISVESDGCELRTAVLKPAEDSESESDGKVKRKKVINWRDVRIGLTRPLGSVTKTYVGKMDSYPEVVGQLFNASVLIGMTPATEIVGVGDGGIGLKEELENQFPDMQFISDMTHLRDHLYDTAEALKIGEKKRKEWVRSRSDAISKGKVGEVKSKFEEYNRKHPNARLKRLIGYIERFYYCIDYDRFKEKGYPIGSGEVESAHRSVPQKRLKLPGACWHPDSINPMLALRILRANDWWNDFWHQRIRIKIAA